MADQNTRYKIANGPNLTTLEKIFFSSSSGYPIVDFVIPSQDPDDRWGYVVVHFQIITITHTGDGETWKMEGILSSHPQEKAIVRYSTNTLRGLYHLKPLE